MTSRSLERNVVVLALIGIRDDQQGQPLMRLEPDAEAARLVHLSEHLTGEHVDHLPAGCQLFRGDGAGYRTEGEVQDGDLHQTAVQPMNHDEHGFVGYGWNINLNTGRDAVSRSQRENVAQPRDERVGVLQLLRQGSVQADTTWHP